MGKIYNAKAIYSKLNIVNIAEQKIFVNSIPPVSIFDENQLEEDQLEENNAMKKYSDYVQRLVMQENFLATLTGTSITSLQSTKVVKVKFFNAVSNHPSAIKQNPFLDNISTS